MKPKSLAMVMLAFGLTCGLGGYWAGLRQHRDESAGLVKPTTGTGSTALTAEKKLHMESIDEKHNALLVRLAGTPIKLHEFTDAYSKLLDAAANQGPPMAHSAVMQLLGSFTSDQAPDVLAWMQTHWEKMDTTGEGEGDGGSGALPWQAFWMRWGQVDPATALAKALAGDLKYPTAKKMVKQLFEGLGAKDPAEALNFIANHPEIPKRSQAIEGVAVRWSEQDPAAATKWALTLTDATESSTALNAIAYGAEIHQGPKGALAWWNALPTDAQRGQTVAAMTDVFSRQSETADLTDQVKLFNQTIALGQRNQDYESFLAYRFSQKDPAAGVKFFSAQPPSQDGDTRTGLSISMQQWGQKTPEEAGAWLTRIPADAAYRDAAIIGYVQSIPRTDEEAIALWTAQISDADLQKRVNRYGRHAPDEVEISGVRYVPAENLTPTTSTPP
jgi:hypothetical protein